MFQFTGFASCTSAEYYTFSIVGCPIRTSADHFVCADPRGFSQLITSFVASESLGIPHTPFSSLSPSSYSILIRTLYLKNSCFSSLQSTYLNMYPVPICQWTFSKCCSRSSCAAPQNPILKVLSVENTTPWAWWPPWWRISESNRWPPACKAGALASWANPPYGYS